MDDDDGCTVRILGIELIAAAVFGQDAENLDGG